MSSWNIAIVGAKGQVGSALVELLENSELTVENLYLVGSDNSEGEIVRFAGKNITIKHIDNMDWSICHLAFFVANKSVSAKYATAVAQSGCVVIDASSAFTQDDRIPLLLPRINDFVLEEYRNENIIAVTHPTISQALRSIAALTDLQNLLQLHITNLVPASFYGKQGVNELAGQSARLLNGLPAENDFFDKQLSFNVLSRQHDEAIDETTIVDQVRRIIGNYHIAVSQDTLLVPVFYGLTQTVNYRSSALTNLDYQLDLQQFSKYDVNLLTNDYPTPVTEVNSEQEQQPMIQLANLRYSYGDQEQVQFVSVSDNIRYLGARLLLEAAETLINHYLD